MSLITKRFRVLGLVIPDNRSLLFASLSRSIEAVARKAGYTLIYGNSGNVVKRDLEYLETFLDRQVDGIILLMSSINEKDAALETMRLIDSVSVPVVAVDRAVPGGTLPTVQMNHKQAGYLATKHLLELGHQKIGCCISTGFMTSRIERGQGYRKALAEFGVPFDEKMLFEVSYEDSSHENIFRGMLEAKLPRCWPSTIQWY